jgi:hypothetical protein
MKQLPLKTKIVETGQTYVDEPIYRYLLPKKLSHLVAFIFKRDLPTIRMLDHYEHTRLLWMKPDGKGGLVPR